MIEVLTVMVIIGIILALVLPNIIKAIEQGNITEYQSDLRSITSAAFMCFTEKRTWAAPCDDPATLLTEEFLTSVPVNPLSSGGAYRLEAQSSGALIACVPTQPVLANGTALNRCVQY